MWKHSASGLTDSAWVDGSRRDNAWQRCLNNATKCIELFEVDFNTLTNSIFPGNLGNTETAKRDNFLLELLLLFYSFLFGTRTTELEYQQTVA